MDKKSLQDQYASKSICFGCGPANSKGLQIKSFVDGQQVIARWQPAAHHYAFPNVLNGGIIGTLLDCHCNWTAAWHLMQIEALNLPPCTVTAEYTIKLLKPTPMNTMLTLIASLDHIDHKKAFIHGQLIANETLCASCQGIFVAVKPSHPAYHRW